MHPGDASWNGKGCSDGTGRIEMTFNMWECTLYNTVQREVYSERGQVVFSAYVGRFTGVVEFYVSKSLSNTTVTD